MKSVILQEMQFLYLQKEGNLWLVKRTSGETVGTFSREKDAEEWMDKVAERIKGVAYDNIRNDPACER